jgi:pyruvate/2-oxoglutarate dehydrogenase complex dihydrolipoamide dehydrogenase (E3) component
MRRFGSKVTMVDRNRPLMSKEEDPDVCEALRSLLADEGVDILPMGESSKCRANEQSGTKFADSELQRSCD